MRFKFMLWLMVFLSQIRSSTDPDFSSLKLDGQKEIHVFFGIASNTILLQMLEFIKLDKRIPKIVSWHLNPGALEGIDKQYNAVAIDFYPRHGQIINEYLEARLQHNVFCLGTFLSSCNGLKVVLHMNWRHVNVDWISLMHRIGADKIKMIHMYEDGMGSVVYNSKSEVVKDLMLVKKKLLSIIGTTSSNVIKTFSDQIWSFLRVLHNGRKYHVCLHKILPVTYHLGFLDVLKTSTGFLHFKEVFEGAILENVDYREKAKQLSVEDKKLLCRMLGIDTKKWKIWQDKSRKKAVFLCGVVNNSLIDGYGTRLHMSWLEVCREKLLPDKGRTKYTWFFKEHPSIFSKMALSNDIKKMYPDMIEIDKHIPFEALILLGWEPDKVCGMWSSVTFSLQRDQSVAFVYSPRNTPTALYEIRKRYNIMSIKEAVEKYGI